MGCGSLQCDKAIDGNGRSLVGDLQQLHCDLLFVEELLLSEVEYLVALPGRGLPDHLTERQLDVLQVVVVGVQVLRVFPGRTQINIDGQE